MTRVFIGVCDQDHHTISPHFAIFIDDYISHYNKNIAEDQFGISTHNEKSIIYGISISCTGEFSDDTLKTFEQLREKIDGFILPEKYLNEMMFEYESYWLYWFFNLYLWIDSKKSFHNLMSPVIYRQ